MSSSESEQEQTYTFRFADMPQISIPSPYSSSNSSDSERSPITPRSAFPFTVPGTSIDPVITSSTSAEPPFTPSGLGLAFSQVEL